MENKFQMNRELIKSITVSFLIGFFIVLINLLMLFTVSFFNVTSGVVILDILWKSTFTLILYLSSVIFSLWFGGKMAYNYTLKGGTPLLVSLKYSMIISAILFVSTSVIIAMGYIASETWLIKAPIIAFVGSTMLGAISFGLMVAYIIRWITKNSRALKV